MRPRVSRDDRRPSRLRRRPACASASLSGLAQGRHARATDAPRGAAALVDPRAAVRAGGARPTAAAVHRPLEPRSLRRARAVRARRCRDRRSGARPPPRLGPRSLGVVHRHRAGAGTDRGVRAGAPAAPVAVVGADRTRDRPQARARQPVRRRGRGRSRRARQSVRHAEHRRRRARQRRSRPADAGRRRWSDVAVDRLRAPDGARMDRPPDRPADGRPVDRQPVRPSAAIADAVLRTTAAR